MESKIVCPSCKSPLLTKAEQDYDHWRQFSCRSLLLEDATETLDGSLNVEFSKDCRIASLTSEVDRLRAEVDALKAEMTNAQLHNAYERCTSKPRTRIQGRDGTF